MPEVSALTGAAFGLLIGYLHADLHVLPAPGVFLIVLATGCAMAGRLEEVRTCA